LHWGKNTRIWMRNLNIDELFELYWYHLSCTRLEEAWSSFGNFSQTFLTTLWGKFYYLLLTIFPPYFLSYFFFVIFSKLTTRKKVNFLNFFSFHQIFQGPNGTLVSFCYKLFCPMNINKTSTKSFTKIREGALGCVSYLRKLLNGCLVKSCFEFYFGSNNSFN